MHKQGRRDPRRRMFEFGPIDFIEDEGLGYCASAKSSAVETGRCPLREILQRGRPDESSLVSTSDSSVFST